MRIVSGTHRGRRINPPSGLPVRPTTDMAKEALFNILNNRVDFEYINALDLFSGTGNISFELASRQCKSIVSVEINQQCISFIQSLAEDYKFDNIICVKANVFRYLEKSKQQFDLIFADPPYDLAQLDSIPDKVFDNNLLKDNGIFVLEHSEKNNFKSHKNFNELRKYGKVHFSFFSL